jgi:hypothetical protein
MSKIELWLNRIVTVATAIIAVVTAILTHIPKV